MTQPISQDSWQYRELNKRAPSLPTLSNALIELADAGHPVMAGSADLQYSNGLNGFATKYPERYVQFGISEQNMVSAAAGMATTGVIPYVATFASFLALLCCEQIRMDVAYCKLPVRLIGHHTGISLGFYGTSHHATEDIAITRSIANLAVVSTADGPALAAALKATVDYPLPIYFRIQRGHDPLVYDQGVDFELGKAIVHGIGDDITIIAAGYPVHGAKAAIIEASAKSKLIITIEEHNILGGLGGAVAEVLAERGRGARLVRHGIKDEYSLIAPPTHLYRHYRLDAAGIKAVVLENLEGIAS